MTFPFAKGIKIGPFFLFGSIKDFLLILIFFIGILRLLYERGDLSDYATVNKPLFFRLLLRICATLGRQEAENICRINKFAAGQPGSNLRGFHLYAQT